MIQDPLYGQQIEPGNPPNRPCQRWALRPFDRPTDLHARVAAAILSQLETVDPASWTPPWHGADPMPHNALTGRRYSGINVLALWCAAQSNGYADARCATYQRIAANGDSSIECARASSATIK